MDKASSRALGDYYDKVAHLYDGAPGTPWSAKWTVNDHVAAALQKIKLQATSLLDLGAGTGQTIEAVTQVVSPRKIVAVDVSPKILAIAKQKLPDIQTVCEDLDEYLRSNTVRFDLITSMGTLELLPNLPQILRTIGKHLTRNGHLMFTYELGKEPRELFHSEAVPGSVLQFHHWQPEEIRQALSSWGEVLVDQDILGHPRHGKRLPFRFVVARQRSDEAPRT